MRFYCGESLGRILLEFKETVDTVPGGIRFKQTHQVRLERIGLVKVHKSANSHLNDRTC